MKDINQKIRVAIIGARRLIRELFRSTLEKEKTIEIVLEAENLELSIDAIQQQEVQVILLDIALCQSEELQFISQHKQAFSDTRIIAVAPDLKENDVKVCIEAGARGYISTKFSKKADLVRSIAAVSKGEFWVDRKITASLLDKTLKDLSNPTKSTKDTEEKLSKREKEVLTLIARGHSNKKIADLLFISDKTVKCHTYKIFKKLNIHRRMEALVYALQEGIVKQDDI